jgi:Cytochrome c oxidase subunit IV
VKVETWIFSSGVFFFTPIGIIYGFVTSWNEPVGTTAILLTAGLSLMIGGYLWWVSRRIPADQPRPEDDPEAVIASGAGELGSFAPYSWWPLWVALATASVFLGLAVGWWLVIIGAPLVLLATIGWVFEFSRGTHAH